MKLLTYLPDLKFLKQSFVLSSATLFSQLFSFLGSLVLFRMYAPSEYGKFGIFVTLSSLLSLIGTGQLQHAVFIAENKRETEQLISTMMILSCLVSVLVGVFLFIFYNQLDELSFKSVFLLPVSILSGAFFFMLSALTVSKKEFGLLTYQKLYGAIIGPLISIGIGFWYRDAFGLIAGFLMSQIVSVFMFYNKLIKEFRFSFQINKEDWTSMWIKFKNFPLFTLPSELINALVNQLPVILLGRYFTLESVGQYKMATTILNLPIGAFSVPVSSIFKQQAAEALAAFKTCRDLYLKSTLMLILTAALPFLALGCAGSWLLSTVFGSEWEPAGQMVQILAGLYFVRFVVSPLTIVTQLTGHQKFALWFNVFLLGVTYTLFYMGYLIGIPYLKLLGGYALTYGGLYIITYMVCLKFCSLAE